MAVPEQVRKQSEDIAALYAQVKPAEGDTTVNTEDAPPAEPPVLVKDVASDSVTEQATPPAPVEQPVEGEEETAAQRYKTLQGMYNADKARFEAAQRDNDSRVAQLEQLLSTMTVTPPEPAAPPAEPVSLVTEDDVDEYGESLDVMRRVSKEEVAPLLSKIDALSTLVESLSTNLSTSIMPEVQRVATTQARSAEAMFWDGLQAARPDWQAVNNDPEFQSWLMEDDPLTGSTRQSYLAQAQAVHDVPRVVAFFNMFKPLDVSQDNTANPNAQSNRSASSELEKQVAPGRARNSGTPTTENAQTYSQADIKQFFDDVHRGKYKSRKEERDRIERDIFAAQRENRIT